MDDRNIEFKASQGDREAQYLFAKSFQDKAFEGEEANFESNMRIAFDWFQRSAMQHYPLAQCEVAEMLINGIGVKENEQSGVKWLKKSAGQGYAPAQVKLGSKLQNSGDTEKARRWYDKAVEQNIPSIQRECAEYLVEEDPQQAAEWYNLAAEAGDAEAQFKLTELYEQGNGVPQNDEEAFRWYLESEKLAYSNFPDDPRYEVGRCYAVGQGLEKNSEEALRRPLPIADPRVTEDPWQMSHAQIWVVTVFADPEHTKDDLVEAYAWLNLAAAYAPAGQELYGVMSRESAAEFRETLGARLSKEQLKQAHLRSKELFVSQQKIDARLGRS